MILSKTSVILRCPIRIFQRLSRMLSQKHLTPRQLRVLPPKTILLVDLPPSTHHAYSAGKIFATIMNTLFTASTEESVIQREETRFGSIFLPTQSPLFPVHSFIVVAHTHTRLGASRALDIRPRPSTCPCSTFFCALAKARCIMQRSCITNPLHTAH